MALWFDIVSPVLATAYARLTMQEYEQQNGTLARYLPNVAVDGNYVEFWTDGDQLVREADYRAFNAPPEIGSGPAGQKQVITLPAISRNEPIDEKTQMALRRLPDDRVQKSIFAAIRRNVWATCDTNERARGMVIDAGAVVVSARNFSINDNFGRNAALNVNAGAAGYWSDATVDRLTQLMTWSDLYATHNQGRRPARMLLGREAWAAFAKGDQFATLLGNGATVPPTRDAVVGQISQNGLPTPDFYDRSTRAGRVLSPKKIYLLPEAGATESDEASPLGATYYGETLTALAEGFDLEPAETPGIVVGVYKEDRIPYTVEVMSDAITEPVAHNANAAMAIQVLA